MATNKDWCKIVDGGRSVEYFPGWVEIDGRIWINPTDEQKARAGWLRNAKNAPEAREGCVARVDRYEARDGQAFAVYEYDAVTPTPRVFSKLNLVIALKKRGIWRLFIGILSELGLEDEWNAAQDLSEDFPMFAEYSSKIGSAIGLTDAEVEAILGEAVAR